MDCCGSEITVAMMNKDFRRYSEGAVHRCRHEENEAQTKKFEKEAA